MSYWPVAALKVAPLNLNWLGTCELAPEGVPPAVAIVYTPAPTKNSMLATPLLMAGCSIISYWVQVPKVGSTPQLDR